MNVRKFSLLLAITLILSSGALHSQAQTSKTEEFVGSLNPQLMPETEFLSGRVLIDKAPPKIKFSIPLRKGFVITYGNISDLRKEKSRILIALVQPKTGNPGICADIDADQVYAEDECFEMLPAKDKPENFDSHLFLPISAGVFKELPIFVRFDRAYKNRNVDPKYRVIYTSYSTRAFGSVSVNGKPVSVIYNFDAKSNSIDLKNGVLGFDSNVDGAIQRSAFSAEIGYATNDEMIFRLGDIFLSTSRIDLEKNQIVMRRREKSEYLFQELSIGKEMQDFEFTDLDAKKRKLSDFRGKYLLVDFWGYWCIDCREQIPFHIQAYEKFKSQGFEILGMNTDDDLVKLREFLAKNKMGWPQAMQDSIRSVIEKSYRIREYPTTLLLGPDGKVLVLDKKKLEGEELLKTLESVIAK